MLVLPLTMHAGWALGEGYMIEHVGWTMFLEEPEAFIDSKWIPFGFTFKRARDMSSESIEQLFGHIREHEITDSDAEAYVGDYTTERFRLRNALTDKHKGRKMRSANYVKPTRISKKTSRKKGRKVDEKKGVTFRDLQGSGTEEDEGAGTDEDDGSNGDDEAEELPRPTRKEISDAKARMRAISDDIAKKIAKENKAKKRRARAQADDADDEEEEPPAKKGRGRAGQSKSAKAKAAGRSGKSSGVKQAAKGKAPGRAGRSQKAPQNEEEPEEDADDDEDADSPGEYERDRREKPHLFESDSPDDDGNIDPRAVSPSTTGLRPPTLPVPAVVKASKPPPSTLVDTGTSPLLWLQCFQKKETSWQNLLLFFSRKVRCICKFPETVLMRRSS